MIRSGEMKRFGEKLRKLRRQHDMTMKELADALEFTSHGSVGDLESGRNKPSVEVALKISRLFNVSLDQLLKDELDLDWSRWAGDDAGQHLLASLKECLQALGEKAKRAIELRYQEEASRAGIATSLGMSEDGAKNLLQRAKQQLRECVERKQR